MALLKSPKILVTGSEGFVGRYLTRELQNAGYRVFGADRMPQRKDSPIDAEDNRTLDLGDREAVRAMLEDFQPGGIIHLAGWAHVGKSWENPYGPFEANVVSTLNLYSSASELLKTRCRFLFISSADVYGTFKPELLPLNEETPTNARSPYGVSKLTAEMALQVLYRNGGLPLLVTRPFNHIGPGQGPDFALPSFARRVARIEAGMDSEFRHGNLNALRDFLDVRDVVRAYRMILEEGNEGDLYVIASGESRTLHEMMEKLFSLAGIEPRMMEDPSLFREVDTPELRGDSTRLRQATGWKPEIPFEQTLADILADARAQLQTT